MINYNFNLDEAFDIIIRVPMRIAGNRLEALNKYLEDNDLSNEIDEELQEEDKKIWGKNSPIQEYYLRNKREHLADMISILNKYVEKVEDNIRLAVKRHGPEVHNEVLKNIEEEIKEVEDAKIKGQMNAYLQSARTELNGGPAVPQNDPPSYRDSQRRKPR